MPLCFCYCILFTHIVHTYTHTCTHTHTQLLELTSDLEGAHQQLDSEADQFSLFQQQSCDQLEKLQSDVEALHSELKCHEREKHLLEQNSEEQRAELVRLRLSVSELELQKESLIFQSSNNDGTISSLKSQVRESVRFDRRTST